MSKAAEKKMEEIDNMVLKVVERSEKKFKKVVEAVTKEALAGAIEIMGDKNPDWNKAYIRFVAFRLESHCNRDFDVMTSTMDFFFSLDKERK